MTKAKNAFVTQMMVNDRRFSVSLRLLGCDAKGDQNAQMADVITHRFADGLCDSG